MLTIVGLDNWMRLENLMEQYQKKSYPKKNFIDYIILNVEYCIKKICKKVKSTLMLTN